MFGLLSFSELSTVFTSFRMPVRICRCRGWEC